MTSPLRTRAPSCDSAQVTTPARSDLVVDSSTRRWRLAGFLVQRAALERQGVERHLGRGLGVGSLRPQLLQLDAGLGQGQLGAAERVAREQPLGDERPVAGQPGLGGLDLELLDGNLAVELGERGLERQALLGLFVLLHPEIALQLVERQHRLAGVELDDGVAALDAGAGQLQDPQHAGVHRAGEDALDLGDDGARGHDHRVDGAGRHAGGADAGARHAGPQQVGQPRQEQHHGQDRHDGDHDADADPAASFGGGNLAIHASRIVKARARSRAPGSATYQRLTGGRRRPASSSVRTVVRNRTTRPATRRRGPLELSTRFSARRLHRVAAVPAKSANLTTVRVASLLRSSMQEGERNTPPRSPPTAPRTRRNDTLMSLA